MDPIDKVVVDGYTYWRVTPLAEVPQAYAKLVFCPPIWGMSFAFFSIAIWLALDLIFQIHITFRRWGGLYYWSVLVTSIGVGIHATSLIIKLHVALSITEDIGTTVLTKAGDVLTQTGFSLVLYSRLNLVMRTQKQIYLKWILIFILVGCFLTQTPTVVITLGVNTRTSTEWFQHARVAEKFVVLWFTLLELSLSTIYTYHTGRLARNSAILAERSAWRSQATTKMRRNLLVFMIVAQIVTFVFDLALVVLVMLELSYKVIFMPFFYGVKLKVEFLALNQLQSLVAPNQTNILMFTGDEEPARRSNRRGGAVPEIEKAEMENQSPDIEDHQHLCAQCGSASESSASPVSKETELSITTDNTVAKADRGGNPKSVVQISQVSSTGSVSELERQYLGRR